MNTPLRVLHLEDEPDFSALISAIFEREGLDAEIFLVPDWTSYLSALEKGNYDIILGDYMLPTCNGIQALNLARQKRPDVPFLLLSGAIGEQAAIEFLRSGATDYILKSRLERLVPAMRRALEEKPESGQHAETKPAPVQPETQSRVLFDLSPVPMWMTDPQTGAFIDVNQAAVRQYGRSRQEFLDGNIKDFCSEEEATGITEYLAQVGADRSSGAVDRAGVWPHSNRDGTPMDVSITRCLTRIQNRDVLLTIIQPVPEPPKLEEEPPKKSEPAPAAAVPQATRLANWEMDVTDPAGFEHFPLRWSDEMYRMFGLKPGHATLTNDLFMKSVHPEDRERVRATLVAAVRTKQPIDSGFRIQLPGGEERSVVQQTELSFDENQKPTRMRGFVIDVTERNRLAEQSSGSSRVDALSELAGELAQQVHGTLTNAQQRTMSMLNETRLSESAKDGARGIAAKGESASALMRSLMAFGRKLPLELRRIDLNEWIDHLTGGLEYLLGDAVALQFKRSPQQALVQADAGWLEQVLVPLAVKARDAMPKGVGQVIVEVFPITLNADNLGYHPERRAGKYFCVSVADNGRGLAAEQLQRVFEPLFPTREADESGGVGLATAQGIVKQHQGWIEVESEPGSGTTFRIYLPAANKDDVAAGKTGKHPLPAGKETVLIADSEEPIREWMSSLLTAQGYTVLQASSGAKALEAARRARNKVDLLIAEVVLSDGLDGRELAERIRKNRPKLKVVFASGFDRSVIGKEFMQRGQQFLQKPYDLEKLAEAVRASLDRAR